MLYHVSEEPGIGRFTPRLPERPKIGLTGPVVWVTPSLWPLRDAVTASTLQFSIIRMRNAVPRP